jgi:hypothetical protein
MGPGAQQRTSIGRSSSAVAMLGHGRRSTMLARRARSFSSASSLLPQRVRVYEVGARDGLQNEPTRLDPATRVAFVELLSRTGAASVEAAAFVSPKAVPQMDGAAAVMSGVSRHAGVDYPVLVPNMKGFEAAVASGATSVALMTAASETFSKRNVKASVAGSMDRALEVAAAAKARGMGVRGYISCCLGCPFEGEVEAGPCARPPTRPPTPAHADPFARRTPLLPTRRALLPTRVARDTRGLCVRRAGGRPFQGPVRGRLRRDRDLGHDWHGNARLDEPRTTRHAPSRPRRGPRRPLPRHLRPGTRRTAPTAAVHRRAFSRSRRSHTRGRMRDTRVERATHPRCCRPHGSALSSALRPLLMHPPRTAPQALANIYCALQHGVATVDASAAGLGGCPFAGPGAAGNVATEDVVYMLDGLGIETGVDFDAVVDAGAWVVAQLGRTNASKAGVATLRRRQNAPCPPAGATLREVLGASTPAMPA